MGLTCSAPGRAGIIGNPTDMYGGSVISCSLQERATVSLQESDRLILETDGDQRILASPDEFELQGDHFDIARAVLIGMNATDLKVHIAWKTDIPFQAGLSGSTSLLVATLSAISTYRGTRYSRYHMAELARMIEYRHLGVFCGYQDAYMCTFGGLNYMDFRGKEFHQEFGSDPLATIEPLMSYVPVVPLILVNTEARKVSGKVHRPIRERWLEGDREVIEAYQEVETLARAGKRAVLNGQWDELGCMMNENHRISRAMGGSSPEDDQMIQLARDHGALGAKLAGSGGTVIVLHPEPDGLIVELKNSGAKSFMKPTPNPGVEIEDQS